MSKSEVINEKTIRVTEVLYEVATLDQNQLFGEQVGDIESKSAVRQVASTKNVDKEKNKQSTSKSREEEKKSNCHFQEVGKEDTKKSNKTNVNRKLDTNKSN